MTMQRCGIRLIAVMVASVVLSACGSAGPGVVETISPGSGSPEVSPSPAGTGTVAGSCPNLVEVVETGPPPTDFSEDGPLGREQTRLAGDVAAASAYGAAHPDEFASVRYENAPRVRMVIGFTANVESHCVALRGLLAFPDEFEIIRQPATEARLDAIMQELVALAGDRLQSAGRGAGTLHLQLRADGEAVAADALARYGDLVEITVGLLRYPARAVPEGGGCPAMVGPMLAGTSLVAAVTLTAATVRSGADFGGTVTVTNRGPEVIQFQSGATAVAVVLRPGSNDPVGFYAGGLDSLGAGATLGPDDDIELRVLGGTASCDPALGYALPPGRYEVRVPVVQLTMHENAPTEINYLLSGPVPLTILP